MNYDQILIKLGVDGTAVKTGLSRVSSFVKGWTTGLMHELRHGIGRIFLASYAFDSFKESLNELKNEFLEIKRLSDETGESTNFIQSLLVEAKRSGVGIESLTAPLIHFNHIIGDAKRGIPEAVQKLHDLGVISSESEVRTLDYSKAVHNLAVSFDKLGNSAKQDALLQDAFGRSGSRLAPVFRQGSAAVDKMNNGNFFTKISPGSIENVNDIWSGIVELGQYTKAMAANAIGLVWHKAQQTAIAGESMIKGAFTFKNPVDIYVKWDNWNEKRKKAAEQNSEADLQSIEAASKQAEIESTLVDLKERQAELSSEVAEKNKQSVAEMSDEARKILGIKSPLEMNHTVTPRMRTALRISNLEDQSKLEWLRGNDDRSDKLQSEAQQIRAANPWLKRFDQNPLAKTESELEQVNLNLGPIKQQAQLVLRDHDQ